jgi:1,2-diacylglycerol 3-alpha-glucosyltransferase
MLIIANTLEFNGGTTFVLRFCRESFRRGKRLGVLVLMDNPEKRLLQEIERYADVYFLSSYVGGRLRSLSKGPLIGFMPFNRSALSDIFHRYGDTVHVMGVFGLLFVSRLVKRFGRAIKTSVGIYHQNEFMFSGVNYYFAKEAQRIFGLLGPQGIVFFNELNARSYARFFGVDYSRSVVVPIGIELPSLERDFLGSKNSRRIVSIGNLLEFKRYNWHVINCMPELLSIDPRFRYEIYGEGPYEQDLRELAAELGVSEAVEFKGRIPYSQFSSVMDGAFVFVGSGTAIIEAAALGVPALIGIESTRDPITYGFLCDVEGLSYNELEQGIPLVGISEKIQEISVNEVTWQEVAIACQGKAETFSISRTLSGFEGGKALFPLVDAQVLKGYSVACALVSLVCCAVMHKLGVNKVFANRRNQGSIC